MSRGANPLGCKLSRDKYGHWDRVVARITDEHIAGFDSRERERLEKTTERFLYLLAVEAGLTVRGECATNAPKAPYESE